MYMIKACTQECERAMTPGASDSGLETSDGGARQGARGRDGEGARGWDTMKLEADFGSG